MRNLTLVQSLKSKGIRSSANIIQNNNDDSSNSLSVSETIDYASIELINDKLLNVWRIGGKIYFQGALISNIGENGSDPLCIHAFDDGRVFIAFSNGEMILIDPINTPSSSLSLSNSFHNDNNDKFEESIESIGQIPEGISAASWTKDGTKLAIITKITKKLIIMSRYFDIIHEAPIETDELGQEFVNVGWGKKETQFHGKANKEAALKKEILKEELSPFDDLSSRLVWRSDGLVLACSTIDNERIRGTDQEEETEMKRKRRIRIFESQGKLSSTNETIPNLEHSIAFSFREGAGGLVASIQYSMDSNQRSVVFIEKNGLKHGEFPLCSTIQSPLPKSEFCPLDNSSPNSMHWNSDSSILSILRDKTIELWTMRNYHWYLKFKRSFESQIISFTWDFHDPLCYALMTRNGFIFKERYIWNFYRSSSIRQENWKDGEIDNFEQDNLSLVASVDGNTLLLTPLAQKNIPPPFCLIKMNLPSVPYFVAINVINNNKGKHSINGNYYRLAISFEDGIRIYESEIKEKNGIINEKDIPQLIYEIPIEEMGRVPMTAMTITSFNSQISNHDDNVQEDNENNDIKENCDKDSLISSLLVSLKMASCLSNGIYEIKMENRKSSLKKLEKEWKIEKEFIETLSPVSHLTLSRDSFYQVTSSNPFYHYYECIENLKEDGKSKIASLLPNGDLHVNGMLILKNCNSFMACRDFLICSTRDQLLKFYPFDLPLEKWKEISNTITEESTRNLEFESEIVTIAPRSCAVILEMPRGNLETIYPRALTIAQVKRHLILLEYQEAYTICRRCRIDLNILCDMNPNLFFKNLDKFVYQIGKAEYLNIFLANLKEENLVSGERSRYGGFLLLQSIHIDDSIIPSNKINSICNGILALNLDPTVYIETIMTAYVSQKPPQIVMALQKIVELKTRLPDNLDLLEKSLKYLMFLVDHDLLFDVSLGMFNLALALSIARRSKKDPQDYLPFLKMLNEKEDWERKFLIDDYLKKYDSALVYIHQGLLEEEEKNQKLNQSNERMNEKEKKEEKENCLNDSNNENKFIEYMKKHELYKQAIEIVMNNCHVISQSQPLSQSQLQFKSQSSSLIILDNLEKRIHLEYAQWLLKNKNLKMAMIFYELLGDYENIISIAIDLGEWQKVIELSKVKENEIKKKKQINHENETKVETQNEIENNHLVNNCIKLISVLNDQKRYSESIIIAMEYLNDQELALDIAIQGKLWKDAQRLMIINGKEELTITDQRKRVINACREWLKDTNDQIEILKEEWEGKRTRFFVLTNTLLTQSNNEQQIEMKTAMALGGARESMIDGGNDHFDTFDENRTVNVMVDNLSEMSMRSTTSTVNTGLTRITTTSTTHKSRKKAERHRARGKVGSPYEREHLFKSMKEIHDRLSLIFKDQMIDCLWFLMEHDLKNSFNLLKSSCKFLMDLVENVKTFIEKTRNLQKELEIKYSSLYPDLFTFEEKTAWLMPVPEELKRINGEIPNILLAHPSLTQLI